MTLYKQMMSSVLSLRVPGVYGWKNWSPLCSSYLTLFLLLTALSSSFRGVGGAKSDYDVLTSPVGAIFAAQRQTSIDEQMFQKSIELGNKTTRTISSGSGSVPYSQLLRYNKLAFLANTENVDFANSYHVSNAICSQLSSAGVTSVFSTAPHKAAEAVLRSFSEKFRLPYISASHYFLTNPSPAPSSSGSVSGGGGNSYQFSVSIRPKYIDAVLGLRKLLGWKKLTYIVDGDEGITRIKELLRSQEATEFELLLRQMDPGSSSAVDNMLRNMSGLGETNIMIDCSVLGTFAFFDRAYDLQMILPQYNYVVVNIAATLSLAAPSSAFTKYTRGGGNITGLLMPADPRRMVNYYSQKPPINSMKEFSTMLTSDSVDLLRMAWEAMIQGPEFSQIQALYAADQKGPVTLVGDRKNCGGLTSEDSSLLGETLIKYIKQTQFQGITGNVQFNERGERVNVGIKLTQLSRSQKPTKLAHWNETSGQFEVGEEEGFSSSDGKDKRPQNHIIITSIIEPPFLTRKEGADAEGLTGNDIYEGYCVSLISLLARDLGFTYELREVKDGQYGSEKKKANETEDGKPVWNGMIGEVIRGEADLAIAPLTINADRQRVVAFSKPFMNIGISIMIKKPQKELPGPLSFLDPFSNEIWFGIIIAYCGLSLGLFVVARFSPTEWQDIHGTTAASATSAANFPFPFPDNSASVAQGSGEGEVVRIEKTNDFSLYNSMWFSLGALMQQGTDIAPRAPASRIVGGVWWFFTLIIISSYTANLAAFLTVETMIMPINNADELANQKEIEYGTRKAGSTMSFFENSQIKVFEKMWDYMSANFENVMVTDNQVGIEKVRSSNSRYAFLIESAMNEYIAQQKPCDTMKVGPNLDSKGYGIAAEYDSAIIKNITLRILQYQEEGELARLRQMWWIDKGECGGSFSSTNTENTNSLGLSSVAGIFYILISGLVLAMVSAVSEYLYKSYRHSKPRKKNGSFKPNVHYMSHQVAASSSAQSEREQQLQQQQQHTVLYNRAPPPSFPAGGSNLGDQGVPGFNSLPLTGAMIEAQLMQQQQQQQPGGGYSVAADYGMGGVTDYGSPMGAPDYTGSQLLNPPPHYAMPPSHTLPDVKQLLPARNSSGGAGGGVTLTSHNPHTQLNTPRKFTDV